MAALDTVRIYLNDSGTDQRFDDAAVTAMMQQAADTLNAWAGTVYTISSFDDLVTASPAHRALFFLMAKAEGILVDLQDPSRYAKFVTQDTQYDAADTATRLNRSLSLLYKDIEFKVRRWIGIEVGIALTHPGESLGGE